jgi:hypothetical protein
MLHYFFQRLPSLAGVLLVVLMLEEEVRLGVVVVSKCLGEVVVRPSLALSVALWCRGKAAACDPVSDSRDRFWEDPSCDCL